MTVGITELPPEGMQLGGVALAGDAERGTKTTEGLSLLFTTAGITVQGPQPQIERLLVWSGLDSASCNEKVVLPDGRNAAVMELTSGGQSIRFLFPTETVTPGPGRLSRSGPAPLAGPLQGRPAGPGGGQRLRGRAGGRLLGRGRSSGQRSALPPPPATGGSHAAAAAAAAAAAGAPRRGRSATGTAGTLSVDQAPPPPPPTPASPGTVVGAPAGSAPPPPPPPPAAAYGAAPGGTGMSTGYLPPPPPPPGRPAEPGGSPPLTP